MCTARAACSFPEISRLLAGASSAYRTPDWTDPFHSSASQMPAIMQGHRRHGKAMFSANAPSRARNITPSALAHRPPLGLTRRIAFTFRANAIFIVYHAGALQHHHRFNHRCRRRKVHPPQFFATLGCAQHGQLVLHAGRRRRNATAAARRFVEQGLKVRQLRSSSDRPSAIGCPPARSFRFPSCRAGSPRHPGRVRHRNGRILSRDHRRCRDAGRRLKRS